VAFRPRLAAGLALSGEPNIKTENPPVKKNLQKKGNFLKKKFKVPLTIDNLSIFLVLRTPATSTGTKISVGAMGPLKAMGRLKALALKYALQAGGKL
jgi:hypothetical protein